MLSAAAYPPSPGSTSPLPINPRVRLSSGSPMRIDVSPQLNLEADYSPELADLYKAAYALLDLHISSTPLPTWTPSPLTTFSFSESDDEPLEVIPLASRGHAMQQASRPPLFTQTTPEIKSNTLGLFSTSAVKSEKKRTRFAEEAEVFLIPRAGRVAKRARTSALPSPSSLPRRSALKRPTPTAYTGDEGPAPKRKRLASSWGRSPAA